MTIFSENNIKPSTKCVICGETAKNILRNGKDYYITDSTFSEKLQGWICFPCRESEELIPLGTVLIFKPKEKTVEKYTVMTHEDIYGETEVSNPSKLEDLHFEDYDYVESPIQFSYHKIDGWRGYYEPQGKGWKVLQSDCILAYSKDEQQLKKFDTDIKVMLWNLGYEFAVAIGRTSNLFSCSYNVLIKTEEERDIIKQMTLYTKLMELRTKYRDPERFRMTALTGKSEDFNDKDHLLAEASKRLEQGENFETVKENILKKAQKG